MGDKRSPLQFLEGVFTRQERRALLFVIGVGFFGVGVIGWRRILPPPPPAFIQLSVNVNTATEAELVSLPGIGPVLAKRIGQHRQRHGRFLTLADLSRVKGVTPKVLGKLRGLVRFD